MSELRERRRLLCARKHTNVDAVEEGEEVKKCAVWHDRIVDLAKDPVLLLET